MNNGKVELSLVDSENQFSADRELQSQVRIFLVDDQKMILQLLHDFFEYEPDLEVVGSTQESQTVLEQIEILRPDLVIIEIKMPGLDGLTLTEMISQRFPKTKVLVLSSYDEVEYIQKALKMGAKGYLLKNTPREEIIHTVRFINKGYLQLGPGLYEKIKSHNATQSEAIDKNSTALSKSDSAENLATLAVKELERLDSDWSEATEKNLDTLPAVWTRSLLYLILVFVAVLLPWAMLSKVDVTSSARGRLEPEGKTVRLDAPVSGTVAAISVREGQRVKTGERLLTLESQVVKADLFQQQRKLEGERDRSNQLELLKNQQQLSLRTQQQQNQAQELEKQAQVEQARQNLESLEATYNLQIAEKQAQVEQARKAIETSQTVYKLAKIRFRFAQEKVPRYRQAYQDGAISKDRLLEVEQQEKESLESMSQASSEIAQAQSRFKEQQSGYEKLIQQTRAEIEQAQLRLQEQEKSYKALVHANDLALLNSSKELNNFETQITNLKADIAQTRSQIESLEYQLNQRVIHAPINGTIFQLPIQKAGAVVQIGQMVAQIAPLEVPLVLRAKMSSADSGFLRTGLPVKIKFDAYPFQDYGVIPGRLTWVSPDSRLPQETNSQNQTEFFELEVKLDQTYIQSEGKQIPLTPGQTATAEVITRQRRVIDFILDPFKRLEESGLQL